MQPVSTFRDLNLPAPLLAALDEVGYETPSPIQAQAIPHLMKGLDLLGHAPTGTGKTAAFALPLLSRLDIAAKHVQVMTLTPTRELAIQVAEAFQRYAAHIRGFHVLPIYGGQDYGGQLRQLKRGAHVIVGTPGRVMDHMRRGTLKLGGLQALVLDEADEMLRMGFIDEVEWILSQIPEKRQMALFSATMPKEIVRIAQRHLHEPQDISIKARTATAESVRQRHWVVSGLHKLDALTRILEVEAFDAVLIFVRTKTATTELAERLEARGYSAAAMNGDMVQSQREQMVERLKRGALDILVATDVAARGLDVDRISHVINYDIPYDTETYIHRIGRTGRAGRLGDAILFVAPRERRMLKVIENATRQKIDALELPTTETVNNKRISGFKQKISDSLAAGDLAFMQSLIEQYQQEHDVPALDIAAALAKISLGDKAFLLTPEKSSPPRKTDEEKPRTDNPEGRRREAPSRSDADMEWFRIAVGHAHGVEPRNIVGAIANEAGLDAQHIGRVNIDQEFSLVELPTGMPNAVFRSLKKVWVCGRTLNILRMDEAESEKKGGSKRAKKKPAARNKSDSRNAPKKSRDKKASSKKKGKKTKA
ncbi:MAG: DEAD/DEAH box helicase [Gammaproteobacteria bacterium]|nr:DEAD/DEAH box helicase [Gammaproteobacteria bacterium]MDX2461182.1 DEAD/DEAH box helicase [Gammaproteobacteria bacterium]